MLDKKYIGSETAISILGGPGLTIIDCRDQRPMRHAIVTVRPRPGTGLGSADSIEPKNASRISARRRKHDNKQNLTY